MVTTVKLNQKHPAFLSAGFSCRHNGHKPCFFNRKGEAKKEPGWLSAALVVQPVSGVCVTQEWPSFFPLSPHMHLCRLNKTNLRLA